ncbi:Citrate transporter [Methanolacinia petrolearia DSM 11571]|uniref:Citrate transporter n=1 Tax=Methanolacinia petrolearia (strain DSM 11571 / OCM 486 / SEBR 4847) TaxID=679926 RepID=E1RKL2_METP4|nr:GntP family permease [Methanolacinia petrolearia]ADN35865.1 Citrate transporter [Methanolacinia petrolearia DSM 11571]
MDPVPVLIITLAYITILAFSRKVPTFLFLFTGAVVMGLLAGFGFEQVLTWAIEGMGNIFSSFAVIILSGIVIVRLLSDQGLLDIIISGLRFDIKDRGVNAGIIGYILSIPTTCCITTYLMIAPAMKKPGDKTPGSNRPLYLVAVGSIISYVLIFPTPATIPLLTGLAPDYPVFNFDAITIPLSFAILVIILLLSGFLYRKTKRETVESVPPEILPEEKIPANIKIRAWAPFIVMFVAIPVGLFLLQLSHLILTQFIMLAGMITALALAPPDIRMKSFSKGAKFAGLILFDFCSAGAVGKVIVGSGIANGIMDSMIPVLPDILVPFIIAAVFATVQGSRVVTAVISSEIIATTGLAETLHPVPLILMISAGTCFISYLTDPYFWLVQRTTGDDITTVMKHYTLPLAVAAIIIFAVALLLTAFVFPYVENAALLVG